MYIAYQLGTLWDEKSWSSDSSYRSSLYKIQENWTSYGRFVSGDWIDYYEITPGVGSFTLVVTTDAMNASSYPGDWSGFAMYFDVKITDQNGQVILGADSFGPDIYTDSITFSSSNSNSYYVEIKNTLFSSFNYAATLKRIVASDVTPPISQSFSPADEASGVAIGSNIAVTFSESIQRGTGSIVLKTSAGAVVATYDAATSGNLSISGGTLTINPSADLSYSTGYKVEFAAGSIKDLAGNSYAGTTSYNFTSKPAGVLVTGTSGADTLAGTGGDDFLNGGSGRDLAFYSGTRGSYTITKTNQGFTVSGPEGSDTLSGVERLKFADVSVALDIDGSGGQAYRIYQAAFNRTPDAGGLGYWINALDNGASLRDVAGGFVTSAEFQTVYGTNPTNAQLVSRYYENVLHRVPEAGGYNYWLGVLDQHLDTAAGVLANISESAENQAGVIGVIGNGFAYTPYG